MRGIGGHEIALHVAPKATTNKGVFKMHMKRMFVFPLLIGVIFGITLHQRDKAVVVGTVSDTTGVVIPST